MNVPRITVYTFHNPNCARLVHQPCFVLGSNLTWKHTNFSNAQGPRLAASPGWRCFLRRSLLHKNWKVVGKCFDTFGLCKKDLLRCCIQFETCGACKFWSLESTALTGFKSSKISHGPLSYERVTQLHQITKIKACNKKSWDLWMSEEYICSCAFTSF